MAGRELCSRLKAEVAMPREFLKEVVWRLIAPIWQTSKEGVCVQPCVVSARDLEKGSIFGKSAKYLLVCSVLISCFTNMELHVAG